MRSPCLPIRCVSALTGSPSASLLVPRPRYRFVALAALLGLSLSLVAPACAPLQPGPKLATGERPVTGDPRYDRLFTEINAMLVAVNEAEREEEDVRGALARRVGLSDATGVDALGARLRERTLRLAAEGLTLELEFTGIDGVENEGPGESKAAADGSSNAEADEAPSPESAPEAPPTATLRTPGREPERRELRLLEVLAQAALSGATLYADMGRVHRRTQQLLAESGELRNQVDASFKDATERERVRAKLIEAEEFLPQLNTRARGVANAADSLIAILDEAANTAQAAPTNRRRAPRDPKEVVPRDGPPRESPPSAQSAPRRPPATDAERGPAAPMAAERPAADFEP